MDLLTLRTKIRKILLDEAAPSASRWGDDDIERFVNEALLEVSRAAKRRKTQDFALAAGTDSVSLPADLLQLSAVLWKETGVDGWQNVAMSEDPYPLDDGEYNHPYYWIVQNSMIFRPVQDVGYTVRLVYFYRFPDLAVDTDTPEPSDVDGILIAYAVWQALDWDGAPQAATYEKKFTQQLVAWAAAEARKYRRRPAQVKVVR